jgi:hypothetical protein
MIRPIHPVMATVLVQFAALALVLGHRNVIQACAVGVAALLFLLANDARDPASRFTKARIGLVTGGALTALVALLTALVPGDLGDFAALVPIALVALYALSSFSLLHRRNRENAPDRR